MQYTHIHRWPSAWLRPLQCVSNGDTADPHQATDTWTLIYQIYVCIPSIYIHTNIYIKVQNADHMHDIKVVHIEESNLTLGYWWPYLFIYLVSVVTWLLAVSTLGLLILFLYLMSSRDLVITETWFWRSLTNTIDSPCIRNNAIVFVWACLSRQRSPVFGQILINVYLGIRILVDILQGWFGAEDTLSDFSCGKLYNNLCCPSLTLPTLWDTDMSCGSTGGFTLMGSQTFGTAASVASWLGFSRIPATRRLYLWPCCSKSSSIVCWSSIVSLMATISRSFSHICCLRGWVERWNIRRHTAYTIVSWPKPK